MEKIDLKRVLKIVAFFVVGGLLMTAVSLYLGQPEAPAQSHPTTLLAKDTLFFKNFKSVHGYGKSIDGSKELIDLGCEPVSLDVILLGDTINGGNEVVLVFKGQDVDVIDSFEILGSNPSDSRTLIVVDKFGRQSSFTMLCVGDVSVEDHKHWFFIEDEVTFTIYSTEEKECEFLKSDN